VKEKTYNGVEELRGEYGQRRTAIRARLDDFSRVPADEFFYELTYCLLTPQSSAVNAGRAVDLMKQAGVRHSAIDPLPYLRSESHYIRFHNTKAGHIVRARAEFPTIAHALSNGYSSPELRAWLVRNVRGLGWKESSHFLRNIGHRNLAILDRHILRNLKVHRVIRAVPATLTRKTYLAIERKFQAFASVIGIPMDELDLLFWSHETGVILK
jgi:N-glycosylase/DNA lyase